MKITMNSVHVDRHHLSARHDQLLNRLARSVIPFAFGFYNIESEYRLIVQFEKLRRGLRGTFGYPPGNTHKTLLIRLSNDRRHLTTIYETFFHEFTHLWQFLTERLDPLHPSYYSGARRDQHAYINDPLEIEAREMATLMSDSYIRHRNNYRWNVPCSVEVTRHDSVLTIVDPRSPVFAGEQPYAGPTGR